MAIRPRVNVRFGGEARTAAGRGGFGRVNVFAVNLSNNPVLREISLRQLTRTVTQAKNRATQLAPRGESGELRRAHYILPARVTSANRATATFGNQAPYARAVNNGSGEYVGRGRIRPTTFSRMQFPGTGIYALGAGEKWSMAYTRGQPPKGWLQEAYNRTARAAVGTQVVSQLRVPRATGAPGPRDPSIRIVGPRGRTR